MADVILSGQELVEKINHEFWFYNPEDANSLVTDAELKDRILSYVWAGFSECHDSSFQFSRALDHGDGRITVFAIVFLQRLDSNGLSNVNEERPVLMLYNRSHFPELANLALSR